MIKKVLYGGLLTLAGSESIMIGTKFYSLFKSGAVIYLGGLPLIPYWLVIEGSMIFIAPILTKLIVGTIKGGTIADDTELAEMIKEYNKEK